MDNFNHRSIEPKSYAVQCFNAFATSSTFTNDGSCGYVAGFQRMHECFAFAINKLSTQGAYFFSYQCTVNLCRIRYAGGMVLDCVFINQGSACTVSHNQTVSSCTVVVRSRETLVMQATCTTSCHDYGFSTNNNMFIAIVVKENSACALACFVQNKFNCRSKFKHFYAAVLYFVTKNTHNFCTGVVSTSMHSFTRSAATVGSNHGTVGFFIEHYAHFIKPINSKGAFSYQFFKKFRNIFVVTATKSVKVMDCRRIVCFISALDTAFCHHGVSIAHTQFCYEQYISTCAFSFDSSCSTCTATTNNQNINIIINAV